MSDFKYEDVCRKGKPVHEEGDSFLIKHPPMELSKRAKIFNPFDALKGFNEEIRKTESDVAETYSDAEATEFTDDLP